MAAGNLVIPAYQSPLATNAFLSSLDTVLVWFLDSVSSRLAK